MYNQLGEEVKRLEIKNSITQKIERAGLPGGIYFYRLIADGVIIGIGKYSYKQIFCFGIVA